MNDQLLIGKTASVATLTLNRPDKANAPNAALMEALAAAARLHGATVMDTRAADLADLVRSALEPGLKERIHEYRKG